MNLEEMERQQRQKRDLTVMGVLVIVSLFAASFAIADTDRAFVWGLGVGVGLSVVYWLVRRLLDRRADREDEEDAS